MKRNRAVKIPAAVLLVILTIVSCRTAPGPEPGNDFYIGFGSGETLGQAMNAAKMDAVRQAVVDLIGAEAEAANADLLTDVIYDTSNPNAFVFNDTLETIRKEGSLIEGDMTYELRIRVNVPAVERTLERNGIGAQSASGSAFAPAEAAAGPEPAGEQDGAVSQESEVSQALDARDDDWANVTPEEERFIRRYVETMTYMVYFNEEAAVQADDPGFLMRSAVNQANSYLVSDGRLVVDAAQVERLKEDQELVYEEETGRAISLLQWVARRLNADVYIELDARVSGTSNGGNHYGNADITLNMYETSTGQILGSVNRRSQNSFSRTSQQDAIMNAVQSTVYQAMPSAVSMAREQMATALTRGIRYEVTVQNPPDARSMSRFRSAMGDHVREIATVSQSPDEAVFEVFAIGSGDDIVDLVYEVSERVAGFEDIVLVLSRGRSMTFDAGY